MGYESFENSNYRIVKNWNRIESNTNKLTYTPLIHLDFNSINFNKEISAITLLDHELLPILPINNPLCL